MIRPMLPSEKAAVANLFASAPEAAHWSTQDLAQLESAGSRVWVDARSMSGDVSSDIELDDEASGGDGPQVEVKVTAMSGDVEVVRA